MVVDLKSNPFSNSIHRKPVGALDELRWRAIGYIIMEKVTTTIREEINQ